MSNIDKLKPGKYAILFRNNWDGEGDTYETFAILDAEGIWRDEDGDELFEYQGDEVLKAWPMDDVSNVLALLDELEAGEQQIKTLESRNRRLDGIIAAAEKRIAELQELRKTDSADREMLKRLYDECDTGERRGNGSQSGVAMPSWLTVEAARLLLGVK